MRQDRLTCPPESRRCATEYAHAPASTHADSGVWELRDACPNLNSAIFDRKTERRVGSKINIHWFNLG
jgi:hypothetical protein